MKSGKSGQKRQSEQFKLSVNLDLPSLSYDCVVMVLLDLDVGVDADVMMLVGLVVVGVW